MLTRIVRRGLAAALVAGCIGPLAFPRAAAPAEPAMTVAVTRNFYPLELWEPGKERRWMENGGEIELLNSGSTAEVNLRFVAESFHTSRQLTVVADDGVAMIVLIPPAASRHVVVKHLRVPPGKMTLRFDASPGPAQVREVVASSDPRQVSVAFGPFSTVASASPEGLIEQTGAFPGAGSPSSISSVDEEEANGLRRQGRFAEARVKYRALITAGGASQLSYVWAGMCALILGAPEEAQALFRSSRQGTGNAAVRGYAAKIASDLDEFVSRSALLPRPDPVSRLRTGGEIYLAVPEYAAVLRAHPDDGVANLWLGIIYAAAERLMEARTRFDRIVQAYPDTYDAQFLRSAIKSVAP